MSDFVTSGGEHPKAPLELVRCLQCGLVQLKHTFSRQTLYSHYWYRSGISPSMREALANITAAASKMGKPEKGDIVMDIGCNDGTLLRSYQAPDLFRVGFEPATNLVEDAQRGTSLIFNDFFSAELFMKKFGKKKAKIITSVAMFYDLEDPNSFVEDIVKCLAPQGIWIVQQNYLATMLEQNGFDNIGHEHLEYYSLETMQQLVSRHGLEVFDVEKNAVNGGSFRTYISRVGQHAVSRRVKDMEKDEARLGLSQPEVYEKFARRIEEIKSRTHEFIKGEVAKGKTVYAYGASNRGNTILQYCGLDHTLIERATDANPEKWGRKTVGTMILIVSKEEARTNNPDYFLVLPHHFLGEIIRDETKYIKSGGKLIVPLPEFRIVSTDDLPLDGLSGSR